MILQEFKYIKIMNKKLLMLQFFKWNISNFQLKIKLLSILILLFFTGIASSNVSNNSTSTKSVLQQQKKITGNVKDAEGYPLPGV